MYSLLIDSREGAERDLLVERLWSLGTLGIVEGESTLEAFFEDESAQTQLADLKPIRIEPEDVDWEEETKRSFPPVLVGERFFLVPPWNEDPTPDGRQRLVINPGSACGTGYHPCTQLCLELLERRVRAGTRVLDVGAGSGILCKAVGMLGGSAAACDIDADAVEYCDWSPKFVGSVDAVGTGSCDLLVANIAAETHRALMGEYRRAAVESLILSGFEVMEPLPGEVLRVERDGWFAVLVNLRPEDHA